MPENELPIIVRHHKDSHAHGKYNPRTSVVVTPALRTSGLLKTLRPRDAHLLLALLTWTDTSGEVWATPRQVSMATGIALPAAGVHLLRLAYRRHDGMQILHRVSSENGLVRYALAHHLVAHHHDPEPESVSPADATPAVVSHVRKTYAVHVSQAERDVLAQLGVHPEEHAGDQAAKVWRNLRYLKFRRDDIEALIETFGIEDIEKQLAWLPFRRGKNRRSTLVSCLMKHEGPPRRLKDVLADYRLNRSIRNRSHER